MPLPNFLVVGAEKAGSTSLRAYLAQHPDVFLAELQGANFFSLGEMERPSGFGYQPPCYRYVADFDSYLRLFDAAADQRAIGECSPGMLCCERSAKRIAARLRGVRVIAMLRQPADRAHSHFAFNRRQTTEPLADLEAAVAAEQERTAAGWHYRYRYFANGLYHEQLQRFYDVMPAERIGVFLYDDFQSDPQHTLRALYRLLGVDESFTADASLKYNVSGMPRNRVVSGLLRLGWPLRRALERRLPPSVVSRVGQRLLRRESIDPVLRARLTERYAGDIEKVQRLIQRDLSHWLRASHPPADADRNATTDETGPARRQRAR